MKFREVCPKRSLDVVERTNYRDYRDSLRADFNNRCGYCNDLDAPRKEYFEIDHLVPQKIMVKKKNNDYQNLVYACHSCNNAKRKKWPSGDENVPIVRDEGWIDPCSEEYDKQFSRDDKGNIIPLTPIGKWMFDNLKLYKPQHSILWNLEQIKLMKKRLNEKIPENKDNAPFLFKILSLFQKYDEVLDKFFQS